MLDSSLLLKKKASAPAGLVLAVDFEGSATVDSVLSTRTFTAAGGGGALQLSNAISKNGTQSLYQSQVAAGASAYLTTPLSADLTFTGDFWMECWGYCLGQGNTVYTGGFNTMLSYGSYASTGIWRYQLDNGKTSVRIPSGANDQALLTGSIAVANNVWCHHAIGRKGSTLYMFTNGLLAGSTTYSATVGFGSTLQIAGYNDSRLGGSTYAGFNGYMDRLRIYNQCPYTAAFTPGTGLYPN